MTVFKYTAQSREDHTETGTIVATSEEEAKKKLQTLHFDHVAVRKIVGIQGLLGWLRADIK
ncbi:MAG: hypothetical protein GWP08_01965 [Nitrospiraceae bacterium]|nr:hypothetical protein [Nitrospiraceae bacterium]